MDSLFDISNRLFALGTLTEKVKAGLTQESSSCGAGFLQTMMISDRQFVFQGEADCLKLLQGETDNVLEKYDCRGQVIQLSISSDKRNAYFVTRSDGYRLLYHVDIPLEILLVSSGEH